MKIKIGKDELEYARPALKSWLALQDLQVKLYKAVETHDEVAKHCVFYVSTALSISEDGLENLPWYDVAGALLTVQSINAPKYDFPFLNTRIKDKKETWDYDERTWYIWAHLFADKYGWSLEYSSGLDVDDAIALAQEIAVEEQLHREWEWLTSEIAYQTKDGFKGLPRPDWMRYSKKMSVMPTTKIRKDFMPSGIIRKAPQPKESPGTV